MSKPTLKDIVGNLSKRLPKENHEYYTITITANEEGNPSWSVYSEWAGYSDADQKIELRQASLVHANHLVETYREDFREGCLVIETLEDLQVFLLVGGHAVIEKNIAENALPDFLKARPVVCTGFIGFQSAKDVPKTVFQRAPTKKQRVRILKRDGYRCKVCGRAPHNNVDITLHLHHIRPLADKGLTHDENLITLCHTCHEGLDPHNEISLFGLLTESGNFVDRDDSRKKYLDALRRYREESFKRATKSNT